MPITLSDIDESLAQIDKEESLLASRRKLLMELRATYSAQEPLISEQPPTPDLHTPRGQAPTLVETIKEVLPSFNGEEFNIPKLEEALKARGRVLNSKHPRAQLASLVGGMVKQGVLIRTFGEKGSTPHKFKVRSTEGRKTLFD